MKCVTVFDDKRLIIPDSRVAAGLISRHGFSPSSFSALESCPARWVADRLYPQPHDVFSPAAVGTGAHKVLEEFYGCIPDERDMESLCYFLNQVTSELVEAGDLTKDQAGQWSSDVSDAIGGIFDIESPSDVEVIARERQVNDIELDGVPFNGFVDRLVSESGDTFVEDYKTSKKLPSPYFGDAHGDQQRLYVHALRSLGCEVEGARLLYTRLGVAKEVDTSERAMSDTLKRFTSTWTNLNRWVKSQKFPAKPSALCGWCPLVNVCPLAQGGDRCGNGIDPDFFAVDVPHTRKAEAERSSKMPTFTEDVPYRKTLSNGSFNIGSYAAGGYLHLVQIACDLLIEAGFSLRRTQVLTLAGLLGDLIADVQRQFTGSVDVQDNLNKNIRWQLVHNLPEFPVPFGGDEQAWEDWRNKMYRRLLVQVQLMVDLVNIEMDGSNGFAGQAAEAFAGVSADPWTAEK